jgi:uncharacterized protein YfbU (UPF0304 family)
MANEIPDDLFKRMVLANQYRILSYLDADNDDFWQRAADQAVRGWPVESLPDVEIMQSHQRDALTTQDQHVVLDALNVFELLQDGLKEGYLPKREHVFTSFPGFDGNNEGKLLAYVRHVVEQEHRFEYVERANDDFNSRMPTLELYQRMISAWERRGRPFHIDGALFDALLDAQRHPSHNESDK